MTRRRGNSSSSRRITYMYAYHVPRRTPPQLSTNCLITAELTASKEIVRRALVLVEVLVARLRVELDELAVVVHLVCACRRHGIINLHDCCLVATAIAVVGCREKRQDTCAKKNKSQNFLWRTRAAEYTRYSALDGS